MAYFLRLALLILTDFQLWVDAPSYQKKCPSRCWLCFVAGACDPPVRPPMVRVAQLVVQMNLYISGGLPIWPIVWIAACSLEVSGIPIFCFWTSVLRYFCNVNAFHFHLMTFWIKFLSPLVVFMAFPGISWNWVCFCLPRLCRPAPVNIFKRPLYFLILTPILS